MDSYSSSKRAAYPNKIKDLVPTVFSATDKTMNKPGPSTKFLRQARNNRQNPPSLGFHKWAEFSNLLPRNRTKRFKRPQTPDEGKNYNRNLPPACYRDTLLSSFSKDSLKKYSSREAYDTQICTLKRSTGDSDKRFITPNVLLRKPRNLEPVFASKLKNASEHHQTPEDKHRTPPTN